MDGGALSLIACAEKEAAISICCGGEDGGEGDKGRKMGFCFGWSK